MSNKTTMDNSGGIGFTGLLTILFILLKAFDKIDWSWWWVFSPLWIPVVVLAVFLGIAAVIGVIASFLGR